MGLADRHYMRQPSGGLYLSATVLLIVSLVVMWILQVTVMPPALEDHLSLSVEGIKRGFVWELFTFQFLHGSFLHLLFNCVAIFSFGRELEWVLGKQRFLTLYFMSGVIGGLFQLIAALIFPLHFGGSVVGASAGGCGLVAAFVMRDPLRQLSLLLYFVMPITIRARTMLAIFMGLAALGLAFPHSVFGGTVAHAAHLGGFLTGIAWIKLNWHQDYVELPWETWIDRWRQWHPFQARQRKQELIKAASIKRPAWHPQPDIADLPSEEFISREVDPILDKIHEHGIQSLTERERRILEMARNRMAKR